MTDAWHSLNPVPLILHLVWTLHVRGVAEFEPSPIELAS